MEKDRRCRLTLTSPRKATSKPRATIELPASPQAYVMPDEPEPTKAELDQMSDDQYRSYVYRKEGIYPPDKYPLPGSEWDTDEFTVGAQSYNDDGDNKDFDSGPIDDRVTAMYLQDWRRNVSHDPSEGYGVEVTSDRDALMQLMIAVTTELNRRRKPPKAKATATGIGLAISMIRHEKGVKHPRDLAKEIGVRAQTLHQIKNLALQQIQRLNLLSALVGAGPEDPGTYNQVEEDRSDQEAD